MKKKPKKKPQIVLLPLSVGRAILVITQWAVKNKLKVTIDGEPDGE